MPAGIHGASKSTEQQCLREKDDEYITSYNIFQAHIIVSYDSSHLHGFQDMLKISLRSRVINESSLHKLRGLIIRNNDATELCITKGQEGFVVGWQAKKGPHGKRILDTLFVKLDKPSKTIQIPGLPENVVPLVKGTKTITCTFPSDLKESIERQQVWVLPNFAMTDYAAQGKTRP